VRLRLALAALVPVVVALGGMSTAQAAPTVGDTPVNHGSCVSEAPQHGAQGGRSGAARSTSSCTVPLRCVENEDTPGTVTRHSATNTVTVAGSGADSAGSDLTCATSIAVTTGDTVTFDYTGVDACGGGVPRVYVVIAGKYYNTHDDNPDCLPGTVSYSIPVSGTITEVGFVYDRQDTGSVTYSNTAIDGVPLNI
jgi:hypothetical protein